MKVNIFGKKYRVLRKKPGKGLAAQIFYDKGIILIDENEVGDEFLHSLLHEMVHGLIKRVSVDQCGISDDATEIICDTVATMMIENFNINLRKSK